MSDRKQNLTGQLRELLTSAQDIINQLGDPEPEPEIKPAWPPALIPQRFVVRTKFEHPGKESGDIGLGVKFPDRSCVVRWLGPRHTETWTDVKAMQDQFRVDGQQTVWIDQPHA
jgi:hypothetical protein